MDETIDMSLACTHCLEKFPTPRKLERHKKECIKPYSCNICKSKFTDEPQMKTHMKILQSKTCCFCSKTFGTLSKLETHVQIHTGISLLA